jgi:hypothetical protein
VKHAERQYFALFKGTVVWPKRATPYQVNRRKVISMVFAASVRV